MSHRIIIIKDRIQPKTTLVNNILEDLISNGYVSKNLIMPPMTPPSMQAQSMQAQSMQSLPPMPPVYHDKLQIKNIYNFQLK